MAAALKITPRSPEKIFFFVLSVLLLLGCDQASPTKQNGDNLTKNSETEKSDQGLPAKKESDILAEKSEIEKRKQLLPKKRDNDKLVQRNNMEQHFNREQSIQLLRSSSTWCKGARQLEEIGISEDILQLLKIFNLPTESSKLCLLEAMKKLGAIDFARQIFARDNKEMKINGLLLMELFPDEKHIPILLSGLEMTDEQINEQALNSLITQKRTEKWIDAMLTLLNHKHENVRISVIDELAWHKKSPRVVSALQDRLDRETSASVRKRIKEIVNE